MKIKRSVLEQSAVNPSQYPQRKLAEIVLLGRSNSGKSTLINTVINRKNLARSSAEPGKTRLLNFYLIEGETETPEGGLPVSWHIVDLPGYGYAKVSKKERENWLFMIERFLSEEPERKYLWQLFDLRHAPSAEDIQVNRILREAGFKILPVAAKADKVSGSERGKNLALLAAQLGINKKDFIVFSAVTKEGKETLLRQIESFVSEFALRDLVTTS